MGTSQIIGDSYQAKFDWSSKSFEIIRKANEVGLKVTVSSAFESDWGFKGTNGSGLSK